MKYKTRHFSCERVVSIQEKNYQSIDEQKLKSGDQKPETGTRKTLCGVFFIAR